ncbi:DNA polymerase III subunit delta [Mycoplasma seminis]|uniref:DNA polymerase III subunit delta n=1 Tax=Mycoplasma seminis TaxID=512749 RepID=A0ABY9HB18_9MOLU|nr:hypothetical protein [Mycoplasma seminis]WLP85759.1 hypothetical protein Q8852_01220 [Mycoplasma seminis]
MILITDTNEYLTKQKINEIKSKFNPTNIIEIEDLDKSDILISLLNEGGLFRQQKLILLKNPKLFNKKVKLQESLINALNQCNDVIVLWFQGEKIKSYSLPKTLYLAHSYDFKPLSEKETITWVQKCFNSYGVSIKYNDLLLLLSKLPNNLNIIENEIIKLSLLGENITPALLESFISLYPSDNAFVFSNAISSNEILSIYQKYLMLKEQEVNINQLFYAISSNLILVHKYYIYQKAFTSRLQLAQKLNISDKRLFVIEKISKNFTPQQVEKIILELGILDIDNKTFGVEYEIFESFLAKNFG